MPRPSASVLGVILALVVFAPCAFGAPSAVAAPRAQMVAPPMAAEAPLAIEQLTYRGAPIKLQLDVNGEAAIALIGGVLDAAADVAREQLPSLARLKSQAGGGPGGTMFGLLTAAAPPLIDPAKDAIKSITHVTLLAMAPGDPASLADIHTHYLALMTQRGWTPVATLRTDSDQGLLLLLAPGGKGLFGVLRPNPRELVVALITTTKPLGDLVAQIIRAGGPAVLGTFISFRAALSDEARQHSEPTATVEPAPPG